jgi:hypothetical protein
LPPSNRQKQTRDHHVHIEPAEEEDVADPERREFLVEKRAHVQMLRRQVDAARSSAESRALHVARVIGPAKRRDRERHQALVHTGEDHPLEKLRRGGRAADGGAPYGEDLLAVLNVSGGNTINSSSVSIARKHQRQHQREPSPSDSMQATPATHARKQRRPSGEEDASDCVGWRDADHSRPSDGGLSGEYGGDDAIGDDPENGSSSARDRRAIDTHDEFLSRQRGRSPGGGGSSGPTSPTAGGQRVHEASVRHDERREDRISGDRPLPEQRETKRLTNAVSHREARNRATKERLNDLKMRLTAAGVDISRIEAKYEGNGSGGSKSAHSQPGDRAHSVPPPDVNPRLYPGHCKIPPPKSAANSHGRATPDSDRGTTSKRVREMDPTVLARLYRGPPKPFQDVEPVEHNICARTALIRANQEPYRGVPALPRSKVPKPAFTEEAVTRMHDAEMRRRQTNLRAVTDSVTRNHVAEVNAGRSKIGMAILKPPVGPDAKPEPGFDRSGLPVWTKDKATRLHDDQCARFARAHAQLEQKAIAAEGAVKIHKPRKLDPSEQKAAASRLHDVSMKTTQAKMAAAAEKANAVNPKAATKFQRLDGAKGDAELQETFNRLHTSASK